MMLDLMGSLRERAQEEAIRVFARNLSDLLLAAPAGARATMGLDPGIRTGVKVAVVDATGKLLATDTVYPFQPRNDVRGAQAAIAAADREARGRADRHRQRHREPRDRAAGRRPARDAARERQKPTKVIVSRGGRLGLFGVGAGGEGVSGARRLAARRGLDRAAAAGPAGRAGQDRAQGDRRRAVPARRRPAPAGEVARRGGRGRGERRRRRSQHRLGAAARPCLGARAVARRGDRRASRREGRLPQRARSCSTVPRLGPRAFEQAAGFLRIRDGAEPLDASAVHPGGLRRGAADRRRLRARPARGDGRRGAAQRARSGGVRRRRASGCRRCATSSPSSASPGATRGRRS